MEEFSKGFDCGVIYTLGNLAHWHELNSELKDILSGIEYKVIRLCCEYYVFNLRKYVDNTLPMGKDADYTELEVVVEDFVGNLHPLPYCGAPSYVNVYRYAITAKDSDEYIVLAYYETEEDANKHLTIFKKQIEENKHE